MDSLNLNSRFEWAITLIDEKRKNSKNDLVIFDVGTENEQLTNYLDSEGLVLTSFDIFPKSSSVIRWDIEEPCPISDKADIIVFLEVIEHINNPVLALRNIKDVLKPGGLLILSTPNPEWSRSKLEFIFRGEMTMFTQHDLNVNHHVFPAIPKILKYQLEEVGFIDVEYKTLGTKTRLLDTNILTIRLPIQFMLRIFCKFIEVFNSRTIGGIYGLSCRKPL